MRPAVQRRLSVRPSCLRYTISPCRRVSNQASTRSSAKPQDGNNGPLAGITVVSLEQAIAAPFCTRQLADLGARVIKVERPGVGDFARNYDTRVKGLASHFVWTNRSKESLALDVKDPKDHQILMSLLSRADVLVQNLAPGASNGWGYHGPYRDKKAYDLLIQSEAGVLSVTGTGKEPAKVGVSIADIAAGMYAYTNILAALFQRTKHGRGCNIDISMLESMAEWMGFPMYYTFDNAPAPTPTGASHAAIYPYGPFETGDGKTVMLGIQNEREWVKFCEVVLEQPSLATDERFSNNSLRSQNRDALKDVICNSFSTRSLETVIALLDKAAIANASVNDMQQVWKHPQLVARSRWTEVSTPIGTVPALLPPGFVAPGRGEGFEAQMGRVPDVGEHNDAILEELGIAKSD